ncbi:MAG: tRNA lysidine(34) synthetase TilS [Cytophagales bacterium]|nr:tRNA lysidine(34) synthetase TilS [Cytophagales bacterium]
MHRSFSQQMQTLFADERGPIRILVSVSGGLDSMVLASLFHRVRTWPWAVGHCDFGLRGESVKDAAFVGFWAEKWEVPLHSLSCDALSYAREHKISIQMAARKLRYAWYDEICRIHGFSHVALAHHADDNLETLLLNLIRGTGWAGIVGMRLRRDNIIRPLLSQTKDQIRSYAGAQNISWREDISNQLEDYRRNKIRHHVISRLKDLNPNLAKTFVHTQTRLQGTHALLQVALSLFQKKYLKKYPSYHILILPSFPLKEEDKACLWEILHEYGLRISQYSSLLSAVYKHRVGRIFHSPSHLINVDRRQLILLPRRTPTPPDMSLDLGEEIRWGNYYFRCEEGDGRAERGLGSSFQSFLISKQKLSFPLAVRSFRPGDSMVPLGLGRTKKLSDLFVDAKIPLLLKPHQPLVCSGKHVIWWAMRRVNLRFVSPESEAPLIRLSCGNFRQR